MLDKVEEIIKFTQELVRTPSQNGINTEQDVADLVFNKLKGFGFEPELTLPESRPSVICHIKKSGAKKTIWLQTCLDTVPVGDVSLWEHSPLEAVIEDGLMYGRGTADTKIAIAIFCYLAQDLANDPNFNCNIFLGFDADEQSGYFTGMREIIEKSPKADICILGYQGHDKISIGSRGWVRLAIQTIGMQQHTGSRQRLGVNAIHNMVRGLNEVLDFKLPQKKHEYFWFGSAMHVSEINGGIAINIVPDLCTANIDFRLISGQTGQAVLAGVQKIFNRLHKKDPSFEFEIEVLQHEPAYITDPNNEFVKLLQAEVKNVLKTEVPLVTSGQGSVGNVVSRLGIPIINAFGCKVGNVHEPDEWVDVRTIPEVYEIYKNALHKFCS